MAAELGFEPRLTDPESVVLPLHHSATVAASEAAWLIIADGFWSQGQARPCPATIHTRSASRLLRLPFSGVGAEAPTPTRRQRQSLRPGLFDAKIPAG